MSFECTLSLESFVGPWPVSICIFIPSLVEFVVWINDCALQASMSPVAYHCQSEWCARDGSRSRAIRVAGSQHWTCLFSRDSDLLYMQKLHLNWLVLPNVNYPWGTWYIWLYLISVVLLGSVIDVSIPATLMPTAYRSVVHLFVSCAELMEINEMPMTSIELYERLVYTASSHGEPSLCCYGLSYSPF